MTTGGRAARTIRSRLMGPRLARMEIYGEWACDWPFRLWASCW